MTVQNGTVCIKPGSTLLYIVNHLLIASATQYSMKAVETAVAVDYVGDHSKKYIPVCAQYTKDVFFPPEYF